ncbi:MAG: hypothetical protein HY865_22820 [Chloroflexi bacterium]|nr:hypothetical protein [Chloroflexota bacterium]
MDNLRKGLAGIFAVLFVLTAILALILFNLESKAFAAETYQQAFANDNFYARIPGIMAQTFTSSSELEGIPPGMLTLTTADWEKFFRELLPPETLKIMGDQALTSVFAYLNDEADTAVISLAPLKAQMSSDTGAQAVMNLAGTLPPCTLEDIARMTMNFLSNQEFSLCNPPAEVAEFLRPLILEQLQATSATLPDQVTLLGGGPAAGPQEDPRQQIKALRLVMRLTPILPLFLLFVMTVLAVRSLRDWLAWWGVPFALTGVSLAVMAWLGAPLFNLILSELIASRAPTYLPAFLLDDASRLASAIVDQLLQPIGLQGLLLSLLGVGMTGLAFIVHQFMKYRARSARG